jgi:hypothetical protein
LAEALRGYLPTKAGLFLYFPARSQEQPKLRAFMEAATRLRRGAEFSGEGVKIPGGRRLSDRVRPPRA